MDRQNSKITLIISIIFLAQYNFILSKSLISTGIFFVFVKKKENILCELANDNMYFLLFLFLIYLTRINPSFFHPNFY